MAAWRSFFRTVSVQSCRKRSISAETIATYGAPYETRTRVSGVRGQRPGPLDEGSERPKLIITGCNNIRYQC
jgi:hypothetical protein